MKTYTSAMPEITLKYKTGNYKKTKISTSLDAFSVLVELYNEDTVDYIESAYALFLNRANNTIGWMQVSSGGTIATLVDPKIIFATALKCNAHVIIISHNHPSGILKASKEDITLTEKIVSIGHILDITVLDHIIVSRSGYISMSDEGLM